MAQKIKLSRRALNVFTNRKFLFIFLFFVIGLSLFAYPFESSAQGGSSPSAYGVTNAEMANMPSFSSAIWGFLVSSVQAIAATLIILASVFAAFISSFAATIATLLVGWILSPDFIAVSYTNPGGPHANQIIKIGLDATQGFVNLGLILALVYIALTTMLGLANRETKKLLFYFVVVALLVNFAPVLCGIVVDASNIAMNAFIKLPKEGLGNILLGKSEGVYKALTLSLSANNFSDLDTTVKTLTLLAAQLVALTFVNIFITIIYLLYALIFMARYVFIWVLVILSPLAFVCYITPKTKKYFDQWLSAFLQWCIIGIPAAFFLNLGEKTTELMTTLYASALPSSTYAVDTNFISSLFFSGVPILFLAIGFVFSLQMSAAGSGAIMNVGKKSLKWTGAKAGGRIGRTLEDKLRVRERAKSAVSWLDKTAGKGGVAGAAGKMTRWAIPDRLRQYSENLAGIEGIRPKYSKESSIALMDGITSGRFTGIEAAAVMEELRNRGDGNDILEGYKRKLGIDNDDALFKDERFTKDPTMRRALEVSHGAGKLGKILRNEPRLAAILAGSDIGDGKFKNKTTTQVLQKYMDDIKNADIRTWEKEVGQHHGTMEAFMGSKGEDAFNALGDNKGGVAVPLKTFDENYSEKVAKWVAAGEVDANKLRRQLNPTPLEKKIELQPDEEKNEARKKEVEELNKGITQRNKKIKDYNDDISAYKQRVNNRYFDGLEDQYGAKRGELGYRKALENPRFASKGWRLLEYEGGGTPTPGAAAMGGTPTPPTSTSTPSAAATRKPSHQPRGRRSSGEGGPPAGRKL